MKTKPPKKESVKPVKIKLDIAGGENSIIPKGMRTKLVIEVVDEFATFKFDVSSITREFAKTQNKDGVMSVYSDRTQKTVCKYPRMSQKDIVDHISKRFQELRKK